MTPARYRVAAIFPVGALLALGLAAVLGLGHPLLPAADAASLLPAVTLPTVVVAGLVDGINPCAFTVLLIFITTLLASMTRSGASEPSRGDRSIAPVRAKLLGLGSIYIGAVFLTYLAVGIGLLTTSHLFSRDHISARVGAFVAVLLGLWLLKDYFVPGWGPRLRAPEAVHGRIKRATESMTIPGLFAGGVLIGLCTVPCSGAVYLAVLSLLAIQPGVAYGYLLLYNLMFVLPLVAILLFASSRPALNRLKVWNMTHREHVRLGLGSAVVLMGLLTLATI
ncbi:MAG: cytochrome c biogenesis CcdA family protein [Anaerolineae bacterium]